MSNFLPQILKEEVVRMCKDGRYEQALEHLAVLILSGEVDTDFIGIDLLIEGWSKRDGVPCVDIVKKIISKLKQYDPTPVTQDEVKDSPYKLDEALLEYLNKL